MTAQELFEKYRRGADTADAEYSVWSFGGDADCLAQLVSSGIKTATASLEYWYSAEGERMPKTGDISVVLDSRGDAVCIIKTTAVYTARFCDVTAEHAAKEGEGDRSLEYWRAVHREFFSGELREAGLDFDETMPVVCEEFELVYNDG